MARPTIQGNFGNIESPLEVIPAKPRRARRAWYVPNHRSFDAFMRSEQMRDVTADVADDICATAIIETKRSNEPDKQHLQDHYHVVREAGLIKVNTALRVVVHVVNDARHAAAVEFGHNQEGGKHTLRDAGAAFGDLKLKEGAE